MMIFLRVSSLLSVVLCFAQCCFSKPIQETAIEMELNDEFDSNQNIPDFTQYLRTKTYEAEWGVRNQTEPEIRALRQSSSNHFQVPGRGCSMNLRPNMDGVSFSSSVAFGSENKRTLADLDGRSTIASTESWCGRAGHNDWIEITFKGPRMVAGIVTQGSPSSDHWTKTYRISCLSEQGSYKEYTENGRTKTFTGNSNRNSKVFNIFSETLFCRSIRIIPKTWHSDPCLRIDLIHEGCYAPARFQFEVISRGYLDGDSCSIKVNGIEKVPNRMGFCVVGFDLHSLTFKADNFNTYSDPTGQSAQMSSFLGSLPAYSVVAIAANDAVSRNVDTTLQSNVISPMKGLGAVGISCDPHRLVHRDSFSFIGQKSRRPDWISCQHVKEKRGYAVAHATIYTSRRFIVD